MIDINQAERTLQSYANPGFFARCFWFGIRSWRLEAATKVIDTLSKENQLGQIRPELLVDTYKMLNGEADATKRKYTPILDGAFAPKLQSAANKVALQWLELHDIPFIKSCNASLKLAYLQAHPEQLGERDIHDFLSDDEMRSLSQTQWDAKSDFGEDYWLTKLLMKQGKPANLEAFFEAANIAPVLQRRLTDNVLHNRIDVMPRHFGVFQGAKLSDYLSEYEQTRLSRDDLADVLLRVYKWDRHNSVEMIQELLERWTVAQGRPQWESLPSYYSSRSRGFDLEDRTLLSQMVKGEGEFKRSWR